MSNAYKEEPPGIHFLMTNVEGEAKGRRSIKRMVSLHEEFLRIVEAVYILIWVVAI